MAACSGHGEAAESPTSGSTGTERRDPDLTWLLKFQSPRQRYPSSTRTLLFQEECTSSSSKYCHFLMVWLSNIESECYSSREDLRPPLLIPSCVLHLLSRQTAGQFPGLLSNAHFTYIYRAFLKSQHPLTGCQELCRHSTDTLPRHLLREKLRRLITQTNCVL